MKRTKKWSQTLKNLHELTEITLITMIIKIKIQKFDESVMIKYKKICKN